MPPWPTSLTRSLALYRTNTARLHPRKGDRVVVAMSGGVDSSVTAALLARQDYDLSAIFMRNWDTRDETGTDSGCEWKKDWIDVQRVCKLLDIPCRMVDLSRDYWLRVFEPSLRLWEAGATPNPDVWCNREVKFDALMQHITPEDTWLATGHYVRKQWSSSQSVFSRLLSNKIVEPRPQLMRPADKSKDQAYYLAAIPERSLSRTIFPLENLMKTEVRKMAQEWKLPTAGRDESMGLCFVGEKKKFDAFISEYIPPRPGTIVDITTGSTVGTHEGLWTYTIGQNARIRGMPQKMFVSGKDPQKNEIYVVPGANHPALYKKSFTAEDWQWIWADSPPAGIRDEKGMRATVQTVYRMESVPCTVRQGDTDRKLQIAFDEPHKDVTPGQIAVVWDGDWCLGCGMITHAT